MLQKRTKRRRRIAPVWYLLAFIAVAVFLFKGCTSFMNFDKPLDAGNSNNVAVVVPKGATTNRIAGILKDKDLITSTLDFKMVAKKLKADGKMKAGSYQFSPSMKPSAMIEAMIAGKTFVEGTKVTIPEGYNNRQIIGLFVSKGIGTEEGFKDVLQNDKFDYKFMENLDRSLMLEGFLFPDTYFVKKGASEHAVVDMMLRQFDKVFKNEYYSQLKASGLSMDELVTLASVVEREAKRDDERARIAAVFKNRIRINMPLQSCATVQYILNKPKAVLTFKDIKIESPYNTYLHKGLPPGPIASPGEKSIVAALYPENSDYLYFVVTNKGDGSHYFGKTGAEHLKNIQKSKQNK